MKIVCEKCQSKYSVDDSKVQNKSFKITCKKCGNKIIVDNTKDLEDEVTSADPFDSQTNWDDDMPAGMGADMEFDDQATKIMSYEDAMKMEKKEEPVEDSFVQDASGLDFDDDATQIMSSSQAASLNASAANDVQSEPATEDWYVHIDGQQVGPLSLSQLQSKIKQDKLIETTNVWKTGMADWSMIKSIPQLASHIVKSAPADPFGALDSNVAAFGNDSLLNDNDAESLFNDKQEQNNASSFSGNSSQSDPFAGTGGGFGGGLDLKSLIDQEDLEEDEEDASSKSKVIDFRDIQGNNNKKIVVQHASFNASTSNSSGGGKGLIIGVIAVAVLAVAGIGIYFGFLKDSTPVVKKEVLSSVIITSSPSGALIYLNGDLKDKTGGGIIKIKPGKYQVKLNLDGYKIIEDVATITKDTFTKKYTLEALAKEIVIKTGLVEADITVGTEKLKTNPNGELTLKLKPASNIAVKVEKDGKVKISTVINVKVDGESEFNLSALVSDNNANNKNDVEVAKNTTKTVKKGNTRKNTKRNNVKKHNKTVAVKKAKKDDLDDLFNDTPKKKVKKASNLPKTLKPTQVLPVIKRTVPKVKACGKKAGLSGKVMVKFKINSSGSVSGVKVAPNGGAAKSCIYSKVRSMRFPKFSGSAIPVTYPFKM